MVGRFGPAGWPAGRRAAAYTTGRATPTASAWSDGPGEHPVRGEEFVGAVGDLHAAVGEQDQVVADPLQLRQHVGGEHHRDAIGGDRLHEGGHEVVAGQRVELGDRLVQDEQSRMT